MLYLLDANTLIDANRDYYGLDSVPQFWEWLIHMGQQGSVKIPLEIYEELKVGNDDLGTGLRQRQLKKHCYILKTLTHSWSRKCWTTAMGKT